MRLVELLKYYSEYQEVVLYIKSKVDTSNTYRVYYESKLDIDLGYLYYYVTGFQASCIGGDEHVEFYITEPGN